jgi:tetratricopeptide (TPR) repeat protein
LTVVTPADANITVLARQWLAAGVTAPLEVAALPAGVDTLALAWALKDICLDAFRGAPPQAALASKGLRALLAPSLAPRQRAEVVALAEWADGIVCLTRGEMAQAVQHLDAAALGLKAVGQPDPAAQTQVSKIMALSMLGQHEAAALCAEAAHRELLVFGNVAAAARVSLNMGSMLARRDLYAESAQHFREAAVLFARLRDHKHSVLADIGLADAFTALGDFGEALRIFARARMRANNQGLAMQLALVDESVALLDLARGHYHQALAGFESARRRYEALALPQPLAIAEKQLADVYLELRLLPEALALFEAAVAKFEKLSSPDELAWALTQRGRTQALLSKSAAAVGASFEAAATLFARQDNAVGSATVALARAELALAQADVAAALTSAQQAMAAYAQAGHADGQLRAEVLHAQALLLAGQHQAAQQAFAALLLRTRAQQRLGAQVPCLTGLGQLALADGDTRQARQHYEAAIELFEDQRRALPDDEIRSAFLRDHLQPYQALLRMALQRGDAVQTLRQLERFRARALDEQLLGGAAGAGDASHNNVDTEIQPLRERLNWLYRHVQRLQDEGGGSAPLSDEMRHLEHELLERARRARLANASGHLVAQGGGELDLGRLQALMQPQDLLIEYGHIDDELFACIVGPQQVSLHRHLASWTQVQEAVTALHFQIDALRHGAAPMLKHMPVLTARAAARLAQLQALLWAPLVDRVADARRLMLVLPAGLGAVPFCALPVSAPAVSDLPVSESPAEGIWTCLGLRYVLCVAASARAALHGLQRAPLPARRLVALGESTRLPHTAAEVQTVSRLFAQDQSFVGEQASCAALRAHARDADVLHLACHAQFRNDNPRFSALHLADGALTVEQAEGLALSACTVVLSACETAVAGVRVGDEQVGLVRAFLLAGASRVVASLWPVDDAVTAQFMAHFYAALVGGDGPAAALQAAQATTRRRHPHPSFWAAFTLYGGF